MEISAKHTIMVQLSDLTNEAAVANQSGTPEADTGLKNWRNLKNHTGRRIFVINIFLLLFILLAVPMCCDFDCGCDCDCNSICDCENEENNDCECDCDCDCDIDCKLKFKRKRKQVRVNNNDTPHVDAPECIPFYSVVIVRWDSNTLTVINNPANNGGYDFSNAQYQWYHNGKKLRNSTGQSLLSNPDGGMLEAGHYHVEIRFGGGVLVTCMEYCAFGNSN